MDGDRCRQVAVSDFDIEEVAALAAVAGVELTHRQAARLHDHTRGHRCGCGPCWPSWVRPSLGPGRGSACPPVVGVVGDGSAVRVARRRSGPGGGHGRDNQRRHCPRSAGWPGWPRRSDPSSFCSTPDLCVGIPTSQARRSSSPTPSTAKPSTRTFRPPGAAICTGRSARVLDPAAALARRVSAADGVDHGLADELEAAGRRERHAGTAALGLGTCCGLLR